MLPWMTLDRAPAGDGGEITLSARGHQYAIRVDGQDLMSSDSHGSEELLAVHGCAGLAAVPGARVLIGGLGMGYTVRAALGQLAPDAEVEACELIGAVTRWNRELIGHLAGSPLLDPRVRVIEGDVTDTIAAAEGRYDAILLDVDNGPKAVSSRGNARLYTATGLRAALRALRPNGALAVWSAFDSSAFTTHLEAVGFEVDLRRVRARHRAGARHWIWVARPPRPGRPVFHPKP